MSSWEQIRQNVEAIRGGWMAFQRGTLPGRTSRRPILRSWHRSREAGVSPGQPGGLLVWSEHALAEARILNQDLLAAAAPAIAELKAQLSSAEQVVALFDPDARALTVDGDTAALRAVESVHLVPGSDWSEAASGTNAMGTALVEQRTTTVFASEHYMENLHPWACVAAPVRHPMTRRLMGVLDLSGRYMKVDRHTTMAVAATVEAIRARLALLEVTLQQALLDAYTEQMIRNRQSSLGLVDRHGALLRAAGGVFVQLPDPALWSEGMQTVLQTSEEYRTEAARADGGRAQVIFRPVRFGGMVVGAVVETSAPAEARRPAERPSMPGLVGSNPAWLTALDRATRAAQSTATVLISGETGTGKEVLAKAIHQASGRRSGPFVAINCGALPSSLAASELFGYAGGAFTGANPKGSAGKVEAASAGTLFLDEVSELAPEAQVLLLRVLQEREVVRVGAHKPVPVDVRVIAASNRDLGEMVRTGSFRQDLFFRVNVVPIHLPPLRDRREDILPLVEFAFRRLGVLAPDLGLASCEKLTAYPWPGNVRELLNLVEQAVVLGEDPADLLPVAPLGLRGERHVGEADEEERIRAALDGCGGNAAAAARALGIGRATLYRKLELYGIRLRRQVQ